MQRENEKRNRRIEISKEAKALKKLRELRDLSLRDVGDLLNVSFTTVSHMENGRPLFIRSILKNS
jgi:transcriptional regulator with XRE-family HTH domain